MDIAGIEAVLLDIEGTTSSISFVHDVLFPYARQNARHFLETHWGEPRVRETAQLILSEAGTGTGADPGEPTVDATLAAIHSLMDRDAKATGLKLIQGWIWKSGYESGALKAHVYPDLVPALKRWRSRGWSIFIYSSGSIEAQKLFFGHTIQGNLLGYFDGHFDTTIGPKVESQSYQTIAQALGKNPGTILFFSDAPKELTAAQSANMRMVLTIRPGNPPTDESFPRVETFDGV